MAPWPHGHRTAPIVPGHEVLDRLGTGGTGEVWVVRRPDGVRLAAKLIHRHLEVCQDEEDLLRRIDHDHVIRLHDAIDEPGEHGRRVLLLDLAEGGSLADAIASRQTLTAGELVTVLTPIARTLHDLHALGLVHADISTGNVLFTDSGKPLLADLGVSRVAGTYDEHTWATEAWAAPEVLAGEHATPASDVYSLGAVGWACVTGFPPPPHLDRRALVETASHVDERVARLIEEAMAFDADERPSAGDFALRLWRCATPEPAPVAGSRGARRSEVQDDSALLTRRMIRERKVEEASDEDDSAPLRRTRFPAFLARHRVSLKPALAAGAATAVLAAGAWALVPQASSQAQGSLVGVSPQASQQPSAKRVKPAASAPSQPTVVTPRAVVTALVTARARAWEQGSPQLLSHALAPGSAADRADRASLMTARRDGIDYRGLRFDVGQVAVSQSGSDRMSVQASINRPSYAVTVGSSAAVTKPAVSQRVRLDLVKVDGQWRIERWS
ncbi:serine/threonine-protein kinase [Yimella sp. cx-51]|uniref:serine/threonine-protein kinase n=1 Tax=Yimella sp. cx-51 TaxID=2770551 RepID=UPI001CB6CB6F